MKFNEQLGFKTASGLRASLEAIDYYPFHSHESYIEIICVLQGGITLYDSAVCYHLAKDEIHIMNSTDPHKIVSETDGSMILVVHLDKDKYLKNYKNLQVAYFTAHSNDPNNVLLPEMKLLRFLMAKTYDEYNKKEASQIELDSLANQILTLLFEQFHDYAYVKLESGNYNIVRRKYDGRNEDEFYRIYRIADYVETEFKKKLTLSEIAEMEFLSVPYLSKYIKNNIGITFSELVSIARCSEAERLLANTNKGVEQIAFEVGFSNRSHFFTHFNRWFSQSPSEYRKKILSDLGDHVHIEYRKLDKEKALKIVDTYLNA